MPKTVTIDEAIRLGIAAAVKDYVVDDIIDNLFEYGTPFRKAIEAKVKAGLAALSDPRS